MSVNEIIGANRQRALIYVWFVLVLETKSCVTVKLIAIGWWVNTKYRPVYTWETSIGGKRWCS